VSNNLKLLFLILFCGIFALTVFNFASAQSCDSSDGWYDVGSPYSCCDGNQNCNQCQNQEYRDYSLTCVATGQTCAAYGQQCTQGACNAWAQGGCIAWGEQQCITGYTQCTAYQQQCTYGYPFCCATGCTGYTQNCQIVYFGPYPQLVCSTVCSSTGCTAYCIPQSCTNVCVATQFVCTNLYLPCAAYEQVCTGYAQNCSQVCTNWQTVCTATGCTYGVTNTRTAKSSCSLVSGQCGYTNQSPSVDSVNSQ
jgi:hypothetical protein